MPVIRPLSDAEYAAWVEEIIPADAIDKVASGVWVAAGALEQSRAELQSLLPDGRDTKDHYLCSILCADGGRVGMIWFAVKPRAQVRIAYVYNIEVAPEHRRQGHAQRALQALEEQAQSMGLAGIALHVFGHNTSAQALYAWLGYLPSNINMYKAVGGTAA